MTMEKARSGEKIFRIFYATTFSLLSGFGVAFYARSRLGGFGIGQSKVSDTTTSLEVAVNNRLGVGPKDWPGVELFYLGFSFGLAILILTVVLPVIARLRGRRLSTYVNWIAGMIAALGIPLCYLKDETLRSSDPVDSISHLERFIPMEILLITAIVFVRFAWGMPSRARMLYYPWVAHWIFWCSALNNDYGHGIFMLFPAIVLPVLGLAFAAFWVEADAGSHFSEGSAVPDSV